MFWILYQKIFHYIGVIANYIKNFKAIKEAIIPENIKIKKKEKKDDIFIPSIKSISRPINKQNITKNELILNRDITLQESIPKEKEFKKIQSLDITQINKNFESLNKSIESLKNENKELHQIINQQINTINQQNEKIDVQRSIENIRFTQTKLNYNKKINILKKNYNMVLNSYKILYYRKISNLILDFILKQYNQYFIKTDKIFYNGEKPKHKQNMFEIIIAKEDIKGVTMKLLNLIIDFFMYIKDSTSSIIHLVFKYKSQIEILYNIMDKKEIKKNNNEYYISSNYLIEVFFGDKKDNTKTDINYINVPNDNKKNIHYENNFNRINDVELQTIKINTNNKSDTKEQNNIIDEIEDVKEKKSKDIVANEKIELNQKQSKNAYGENNMNMSPENRKKRNKIIEDKSLNLINEDNKYGSEDDLKEYEDNKINIEDDIGINTEKRNIVVINKNKGTSKNNDYSQSNKDKKNEGLKRDKITNNKLKKVGEICNKLEKCESDIELKEIVEEIEKLNINDLLEKDLDENNKNKIDLLNQIFDLIKENSENSNLEEETCINGEFLFNEWKKSFDVGYKQNNNFKLLVVYDDNINLKQIKDATIKLINNMNIKIFSQDPGKFAKNIKTMILEDKFYEYNQQLTKN